jgi:putative endonuclease
LTDNINIGNRGEAIAKDYLIQQGFTIIAVNWRYKHWEIDIICSKENKLFFIEVKTRSSNAFGHPEQAVTTKKLNAIKKGAEQYLLQNPNWQLIQFNVIAIILKKGKVAEIEMIEDVF